MAIYMMRERVPPTESIVYKMKADTNGQLYIPARGSNSSGNYASYNWKISVDEGTETTYSGTASSSKTIILEGYTAGSEHTILIVPTTEGYQWARAFSFGGASNFAPLVTEIVYDGSYMGYGESATSTGGYFKYYQYVGCTNITKPAIENLPNTVTTIGTRFRAYQYYGCTGLLEAGEEFMPSSISSIGVEFRRYQYGNCTSLSDIKGWKDLSVGNSYYRDCQYYGCTTNKTVKVLSNVGYSSRSSDALDNSYVTSVSVPSAYLSNFKNSSNNPRVNIDDSKFVGY